MPFEHLLEYALASTLNHVSVAGNDSVKVPASDLSRALVETVAVARAGNIPQESFLPRSRTHSTLEPYKQLRQEPTRRIFACPRELLPSRQVEHHIRLDEGLVRLMTENQLLIRMTSHILVVELTVEFGIDFHVVLVFRCPYMLKFATCGSLIFLTLLRKALDAEKFGRGKSFRPVGDEDVVLEVESSDVANTIAHRFDCCTDFWGEGCWREDG